ncbi:DNA cytosine methyltransferase [Streptomyces sp. NPDC002386]
MTLRIGSLFSGYGGLDMGVQAVLGGEIAWHCQYDPEDKFQYAARILAHHWPEVRNLGDITLVDWLLLLAASGRVDVLTGGFPCTDLSVAGQRAGLLVHTRSGLWRHMARAIAVLRPRLVVIENVRGILSTQARSPVESCTSCVDHAGGKPVLRALGAVLGDLAALGFDAEWAGVRASEVGAPHERFREFILAWPADADGEGLERARLQRSASVRAAALADAARVGPEGRLSARRGRSQPEHGGLASADADGDAVRQQSVAESRRGGAPLVGRGDAQAAADAASVGRREGRPESAGQLGRSDAAERGGRAHELDVAADDLVVDWGEYGPAVERWETILGRRHPWPTNDRGQLAAEFDEWMMGLPEGHLCSVPPAPGMTAANLRNARIKAAGNGVVPLQAAAAVRLLLDRVAPEVPLVRQLIEDAHQDTARAA